MAEFKLGRIKFVWQGAWTTATTYYKDDVVRYGGKTYICAVGHTAAADFNTDLEFNPTKWNQMSDGVDWKGSWTAATFYKINDLVQYGGIIYVCNDSHTSAATVALGLEADQSKWTLFVEGLDWKSNWGVSTRYKVNDLVQYGGVTYVCNTGHTSAATSSAGLEADQAKWDEFNQGFDYLGTWTTATRYKINDVVKYGAGLWICTTQHTAGATFAGDSANWSQLVEGFEFEDTWNSGTAYQPGDIVRYGGNQYAAKTQHTNSNPVTGTSNWDLFTEGLKFQSDWSNTTSYRIGEVVRMNGYTYLATADSPSTAYTVTASNAGTTVFTTASTTGMVANMAVRFTGSTFGNVLTGGTYYIKQVVNSTTFTVSTMPGGTVFTPATAAGSMTATVSAMPPNTSYWARLNSGMSWQGVWVDDTEYNLGDVVRFGSNAYICVQTHRSEGDDGSTVGSAGGGAANSRPDLDVSGTYWNSLSIGSDTAVLTVRGDLVYYGGAGPTRLPVGTEGQILRVAPTGDPEWRTLWSSDFRYFVGPHGEDRPAPLNGLTLDKPWKTIRYAAEQVLNGPRYPNAKRLLELNRVFIQREVTEWIRYQVNYYTNTVPTPASTWFNFDWDEHKCERDTGLIVDALMYDIGHGGNVKSRGAANAYVGGIIEDSPGAYPNLATESLRNRLAFAYMLQLVEDVLNQDAPTVNYQVTNGDNSTSVVAQAFDTDILSVETGAMDEITDLVTIVINALEDQSTANIPARYLPNTVINIATGRYRETLPIIVPEGCCVIGDEVRAVNAGPAGSLVHITDAPYSIGAIGRLSTVVSQIVQGSNVTETSGNIETQSIDWPLATNTEGSVAQQLARTMQHRIDWKLGTLAMSTLTDPTGYGSTVTAGSFVTGVEYNIVSVGTTDFTAIGAASNTVGLEFVATGAGSGTGTAALGYSAARKNIKENKKFFQEEVIGYTTTNYPGVKYSKTKCKRDVGYIVDAIVYDLTYGGSTQSLNAGLAYYDGPGGALQFDSSELVATLQAMTYLKNLIANVAQSITTGGLSSEVQFKDTAASSAAATRTNALMDIIIAIITTGTTARPSLTVTTIATNDTFTTSSAHGLVAGDLVVPRASSNGLVKDRRYYVVSAGLTSTQFRLANAYGGTTLTSFTNGSGLTITVDYEDRPLSVNSVSSTTALISAAETLSAARETIVNNVVDDLNAVAWHTDFVVDDTSLTSTDFRIYVGKHTLAHTYVSGGTVTKSDTTTLAITNFVYNNSTGYAVVTTATHGLSAGDIVNITDILVSCTSAESSPNTTTALFPSATGTRNGVTKISYLQNKCLRDIRIILDAVAYDFMFNSNFQTLKAAYSYLRASASDVFEDNQKQITRDALTNAKDEAKSNVGGNATAQSRIETLMTMVDDIIFGASNEGSYCATESRTRDYAVLQLERNRNYIVAEIDAWIADTYSDTVTATATSINLLTISDTSWLRRNLAIKFTGTVFGGVVAGTTYYVQNIINSTQFTIATTRDVNFAGTFNLSTATGSMSIELVYDSTLCLRDVHRYIDAIKYDIKYPGNYKSLLSARYYANAVTGSLEEDMYYLRNATGVRNQTLDGLTGDLLAPNAYGTSRVSAGAYCSLDPGFGPEDFNAWIITRSPYVQNVTTFGYAAIGQKIDGSLHNGGNDSIVSNDFTQVISDGIGAWITNNGRAELVSVFTYYAHIGYLAENGGRIRGTNGNNSYGDFGSVAEGFDSTETPDTAIVDNKNFVAVVGSVVTNGSNILGYEFDNAGEDYSETTWTVSGGGISADVEQGKELRDGAVMEVRLLDLIDDSTNAPEADGNFGGFGYVSNANTAQGGTSTSITLAATDNEISSAYTGMKVFLTGGTGVGQFALISSYNSGTKVASLIKETTGAAGWDHVVPGTTIVSPDASTTYVVEPALSFTAPSFTSSPSTLSSSLTWVAVEYAATTTMYTSLTGSTSGSGSGATWNVLRRDKTYYVELITAGTGYERLDTITILGTSLGGATTANDLVITILNVSTTGAIQAYEKNGYGRNGAFLAIADSTRDVARSVNGSSWTTTSTALPSTATWTSLASGQLVDAENAGSLITGRAYKIAVVGNTNWIAIGATSNTVGVRFVATGAGAGTGQAYPEASYVVAVASGGTTNAYSTDGGVSWTAGSALPSSGTWSSIAYGDGAWVAVRSGSTAAAVSNTGGSGTWTGTVLPSSSSWTGITYGAGKFVAVASGGTAAAYSTNRGSTWTAATLPSSTNWNSVAYGNNRFVAVSNTNGTAAAYSLDGITWVAATLPATAQWTSVTYGQGVFLAVSQSTQAATSEDGIVWTSRTMSTAANGFSSVVHGNPNKSGYFMAVQRSTAGTVASSTTFGARAKARAFVADTKIFAIRLTEPGSGYSVAPTLTITDPNNTFEAPTTVRLGYGVLGTPAFVNRGTTYTTASAEILEGDGHGNFFQPGAYIAVKRLTDRPVAGSNVVFSHLPNKTFKLVNVVTFLGTLAGSYTAFLQVSPALTTSEAPAHETSVSTRIRYSQVRLTGHDFLDIGTGNFVETNYPGLPTQDPIPANETFEDNGGRVFYTSTDQDGNFRVGGLFNIEQSTGIATLNADAFNISGLQELSLGEVTLGGGSATISEFSTDPFFTADSDTVVPTQRAIKAFIASQIGGGGAALNVNSVTAGFILINNNQITTTTGGRIQMKGKFDFRGPVTGLPLAFNYFLN